MVGVKDGVGVMLDVTVIVGVGVVLTDTVIVGVGVNGILSKICP